MRSRVLAWVVAGVLPLALAAGCASDGSPEAGGSSSSVATTAAGTSATDPPTSDTATVTEPATEPVTQPVTDPVTQPPTDPATQPPAEAPTPAPGPPTVAPRGATRVIVLNAGYKDGGASATTDGLNAIGYQVLPAENAYEDRKTSAVYFHEGWELSAREIADASGIPQDLVAPMPDHEISNTDPREYDVAVLLGRDRR